MDLTELNARIKDAAEHEPDVRLVAQKVLANLSAADQRDVLALVLPAHVRTVMTEPHRRVSRPPDQPARGRVQATYPSVNGKTYASFKQRDGADWVAITGSSIGAPGGRKFFGEFTADEVVWLSAQRRAQAEALLRQAGRYKEIAKAMQEAGVERVKDLDPTVLLSLMRMPATQEQKP